MFHMLSYFDLKPGVTVAEYDAAMQKLAAHLIEEDLIVGIGPLGKRATDTILDTDEERSQQYSLMMDFRDKVQSDRAVEYIEAFKEPGASLHIEMFKKITNSMFVSWQDLDLK